jgi:hypothetical protein
MWDFSTLYAWAYRKTKDPQFLYQGRRQVGVMGVYGGASCRDSGAGGTSTISPVRQGYVIYGGWPAQEFVYTDLHQSEFDIQFLNDDPATYGGLQVTNNGGGSYTLGWTVPQGATRYHLKFGPQVMVPNLNFDKYARVYQYNPAVYDNFWAGNGQGVTSQPVTVANEPTPGSPGTQQRFAISGLDPSKTYHFAMRIETSGTSGPPPTPQRRPTPPTLL